MANYNIDAIYNGNTSLPGTERIRIDSSGNVGIGTASPIAPLDVQSNTGGTGIIIRGRSDNSTALRFYANNATTQQAYIGADDSNIDFLSVATRPIRFFVNSLIQYQINQLGVFSWYDGAGGTRMTLNSTGLGIGTTSPNTPLDVVSTSGANALQIRNRSDNDYGFIIFNNYAGSETSIAQIGAYRTGVNQGSLLLYTGTTEKVRINNDGNVGIGTSSPSAKIELYNGNFKISDGNRIIFGASDPQIYGNSGVLTFRTNSSDRMYLDANGNLGIGTSSPLERITFGSSSSIIARSSATDFNSGYCSRILFNEGGTGYGYLGFYTYQGGTGGGERMRITESGNVGIGIGSPDKKLQIIGSLGKGLNLYEVPIDDLVAAAAQAKRFEIARVFIDYNDWNHTGAIEIEVRESYYSDGRYKKYIFSYGYSSSNVGSLWLIEDAGRGANDFKAEVGAAVLISGDIYYVPIYIDVDYYQYVDVLVRTNRTRTTNASSAAGGVIYINESPTGSNISSFSPDEVTYLSLASSKTYLGYSGNVGIGTASPAYKLDVNGDGRFIGNIAIITDASTGDYSLIAHKYAGVTKAFSGYNGGLAIYGGEAGTPTRIQANGQYVLTALTNGNIGIGTTSPISKLQTYATNTGAQFLMSGADGVNSLNFGLGFSVNSQTFATIAGYYTNSTGSGSGDITFYTKITSTALSEKMRIQADGNVGIGAASPDTILTLEKDVTTTAEFGSHGHFSVRGKTNTSKRLDLGFNTTTDVGFIQAMINGTSYNNLLLNANGGNVGIGTTSPSTKLQVKGVITAGSVDSVNGSTLLLGQYGDGNLTVLGTEYSSGGPVLAYAVSPSTSAAGAFLSSTGITISRSAYTQDGGTHRWFTGASQTVVYGSAVSISEKMRIDTNGNVGIGTTSPLNKLSVISSNTTAYYLTTLPVAVFQGGSPSTVLVAVDDNADGLYAELKLGNAHSYYYTNSAYIRGIQGSGIDSYRLEFGTSLGAAATTKMTILSGGNVGIGTTSPSQKLHVLTSGGSTTAPNVVATFQANTATTILAGGGTAIKFVGVSSGGNLQDYDQCMISSLGYVGNNQHGMQFWVKPNASTVLTAALTIDNNSAVVANSSVTAASFSGAGTGLTGTAASLSIGGAAGSINGFNNPTTAATVNTIVYRDSGGDIYGRYLFGSYVNSSDDTSSTGLTYIMAKFGDNYHRSASAAKVATFISGQTMDINGSSTSCSGSAASAGALNTNNDYTVASLTSNGFVYSGSGAGSTGAFYFNTSSHGIRRASGTNDVYCYTTSGTLYLGAGGSSTTHVRVTSGGDVGIGVSPSYKLDVNGNIHATAFPTSSDIRFKKNITALENSLEKVKKLQGVKYEWNEFVNSVRDGYKLNVPIIGLIAQDVEKIVPEVIDLWELSEDCKDARSIDYPRLTPLLIEAIKEQQIIIENQNQKIENLIARMSALEAK